MFGGGDGCLVMVVVVWWWVVIMVCLVVGCDGCLVVLSDGDGCLAVVRGCGREREKVL